MYSHSQPALQTELGIRQDFRTYVNPPRSKNRNRMVVMVWRSTQLWADLGIYILTTTQPPAYDSWIYKKNLGINMVMIKGGVLMELGSTRKNHWKGYHCDFHRKSSKFKFTWPDVSLGKDHGAHTTATNACGWSIWTMCACGRMLILQLSFWIFWDPFDGWIATHDSKAINSNESSHQHFRISSQKFPHEFSTFNSADAIVHVLPCSDSVESSGREFRRTSEVMTSLSRDVEAFQTRGCIIW